MAMTTLRIAIFPAAWLAMSALPADAQTTPVGLYRAQAGPDLASAIEIAADGRFRYQLSEGALDEQASGRWTQEGDDLLFDTLPKPREAEWQLKDIGRTSESPLTVAVEVQGGEPLAGIFFRIGFANGDRQAAMTQYDGWAMSPDETRKPAWIEFEEPIHGASSPRFDLPDGQGLALKVVLVPNEIGVAAFEKTHVSVTRDGLVLHWRGRDIRYVRARPAPESNRSGGITITTGPN